VIAVRHPLFWGIVLGVVGTWAFHAIMPGARAVAQPGG
jgi:hypothetical protein